MKRQEKTRQVKATHTSTCYSSDTTLTQYRATVEGMQLTKRIKTILYSTNNICFPRNNTDSEPEVIARREVSNTAYHFALIPWLSSLPEDTINDV
jgi:hypothetical protein